MIKQLRKNSKKAFRFYHQYLHSNIVDIYQAYAKPSVTKVNQFRYLEDMAEQDDGSIPRILSYNTYQFTVGYRIYRDGKWWLKVITKEHIYLIEL